MIVQRGVTSIRIRLDLPAPDGFRKVIMRLPDGLSDRSAPRIGAVFGPPNAMPPVAARQVARNALRLIDMLCLLK